nr:phage holin family protein [Synergistaceae bacterium]
MIEHLDWIAGFIGAAFGWYFGALDGLFYALITLVITDYITGVLAAYTQKK